MAVVDPGINPAVISASISPSGETDVYSRFPRHPYAIWKNRVSFSIYREMKIEEKTFFTDLERSGKKRPKEKVCITPCTIMNPTLLSVYSLIFIAESTFVNSSAGIHLWNS